jgi:hypothetical protein
MAIRLMPKHLVLLPLRLLLLLPARRDSPVPLNMLHVKSCQRPWQGREEAVAWRPLPACCRRLLLGLLLVLLLLLPLRLLLLLPARHDSPAPLNMLHVKSCQRPWQGREEAVAWRPLPACCRRLLLGLLLVLLLLLPLRLLLLLPARHDSPAPLNMSLMACWY